MTTQDQMKLISPSYQNVFLLSQNPQLIENTKKVNRRFIQEIQSIKNNNKNPLTRLLLKEIGSEELLKAVEDIAKRSDLYKTPDRTLLLILVILLVLDANPTKTLLYLDQNKVPFNNPIWWTIDSGQEGTALTISLSNFHSKTDLVNFIEKRWPEIEKARKPFKIAKTKIERPKPYTDFARDWQMYLDKQTMSYSKLAEKYGFSEVNSAKMIISKLRKRIAFLYSS